MNHPTVLETIVKEKIQAIQVEGLRNQSLHRSGLFPSTKFGLIRAIFHRLSKILKSRLKKEESTQTDVEILHELPLDKVIH